MFTAIQTRELQRMVAQDGSDRFALLFAAVSEESRVKILRILRREQDTCVTDVANVLGISVPAASQHLKVLETAEFVWCERMGQMSCYRIRDDEPVVQSILKIIL